MRLDKALTTHPEIESRSQATSLIDRGFVKLDNYNLKPAYKTQLGQIFNVLIQQAVPSELLTYDFKLDIVYEDDSIIVVNKPSGLVVHPAVGHYADTLVNALLHHTNQLASGFTEGRPGIVHRIDKETSGLLVVAKTDSALRKLALQFKKKSVHRRYWAVCFGHPKESEGTITSYIRRHPKDRKKFASEKLQGSTAPLGKLAITHYEVIKKSIHGLSLLSFQLETGRTHQIRVHISELGHPIVSDPVYCTPHRVKSIKSVKFRNIIQLAPHLILHAAELGFEHPTTRKKMIFKAPWPIELSD
ncbi:MAG: RluA family pseudouridine synthase, partial [Bdellovibrionales bacterium]